MLTFLAASDNFDPGSLVPAQMLTDRRKGAVTTEDLVLRPFVVCRLLLFPFPTNF
jgi:hypothetical protein